MSTKQPTAEEKKFLINFFEYVQSQFGSFGDRSRLFIEKTCDISKYGRKSEKGKIGIIANSDLEAKILLIYLKILIDNDWRCLLRLKKMRYDYDGGLKTYYQKLLKIINSSSFFLGVTWYLEDEEIEIVKDYEIITVNYNDVDKWDLYRITEALENLETKD